ncbi:MAG: ketoacyl-ACP synthase III [Chitinophagaceae bacterium]|nr:MAG: ketoacyl-ACP synthase III [Chitinophagaceae bacterium]
MYNMGSVISGSGCYIPPIVDNEAFADKQFFDTRGRAIAGETAELIRKFEKITGIRSRGYAPPELVASDLAITAARNAIADAAIDAESLSQVIVAHNFGNVSSVSSQVVAVPTLAARVKQSLQIRNPSCIAYDIQFGCAGWIQAMIQADVFIRSGAAEHCLVIGADTVSRVVDKSDRDSLIFSDGAGAVILSASSDHYSGILASISQSWTYDEADYIDMGNSNDPSLDNVGLFLKMDGRPVYDLIVRIVPQLLKDCMVKANLRLADIKKIFVHQANAVMDTEIIKSFYKLFGVDAIPESAMPSTVAEFGNSSVATLPTMLDMVRKGSMPGHSLSSGDVILFASFGAGMSVNVMCYKQP